MELANKATRIKLFDFKSIQMRSFHMTWLAFHLCFFGWFGIAPLMAVVREDLDLTKSMIGSTIIASVAITVLVRLIIGPLCDKFGPRKTYTWLLVAGSLPVMGIGFADSFETFLLARLTIGAIGASFVITQYHTSVMFAPNVVGTANATTAGWGNLGGGTTQIVMPLIFAAILTLGVNEAMGWRLAMVVPGIVLFATGIAYWFFTQDAPDGNYDELRAAGRIPPAENERSGWGTFKVAARDYRVWALFVVYAACFGVELTINNVAAIYFFDEFSLDLKTAGLIAGLFGLMNLFARTLGGFFSDLFARHYGLRGRVQFLFMVLFVEGLALIVFSQMTVLALAIGTMIVFSLFTQMSEGATYGLVPFMNKKALGAVAGIVGAGGNAGAVAAGFLFKSESLSYGQALFFLGCAVMVCSFFAWAVRFSPEVIAEENLALGEAMADRESTPAAVPGHPGTIPEKSATAEDAERAERTRERLSGNADMRNKLPEQKQDLVVIGNGMAGMRTVEELLKLAPEHYNITVFGAEPYGNYNRIMLSPLLAGEAQLDEIMINTPGWYEAHGITLYSGDPVDRIDRRRRMVHSATGREVPYDRLLLATGSSPFVIPVPGHDLPGVTTFRDVLDVNAMLDASKKHKKAVVIGGGLLGLEAANGLLKQGMDVTVVHLTDSLMDRQLDSPASRLLQQSLEQRGMRFRMQAQTEAILGRKRVRGIRFKDGEELEADMVVMAVGIRPNIELAESCGLHCEKGVVVNDTLQTYDPRIYAVGECVQHRNATYGLVAPLWDQAQVCATHLAQVGSGRYQGSVTSTKLKVTGIDLFSAGDFTGDETTEDIVLQDRRRGVYKRLVLRDDRIAGTVLYGDTADGNWYFQLMKEGRDISDIRDRLVFGRAYAEADGPAAGAGVAEMPDDTQICDCNGVCKGDIVAAIGEHGLKSVAAVGKQTKAGTSCGSCQGLVAQLVEATLGEELEAAPAKAVVCECTDYSHDEVRAAIREQHLTTTTEVREALAWKQPDGCAKCRPALNYYCIAAWPGEAEHEDTSRFINERAHANIQKDGTYSVVPRMFGGVTNPRELRAIADVADKYEIPTVKVTGGQRIDLLGVKKEDLPDVWRDLREQGGLISGHAYAKALRTVKTCVGKEWCRFGLQESTQLGIELEQLTWGSWMPHKFKMAVSGCPRNCAEASIKDFGIVCLESGYELQVGGNGGMKLRGADVLCRVTTPEEVTEYCLAFIQLYREEGHYFERSAPFIERVGLDYVTQRVVEDGDDRQALAARFLYSQQYHQSDPWEERSSGGVNTHEYIPLKQVS